ncbi:MAG: hypothetical protein CSA53_00175, partial [Gammaproteobacteria bacterium]
MKKTLIAAAVLATLTTPLTAFALDTGDLVVRAGLATVAPNEDSDAIPGLPINLPNGVKVENDTQLGLTVTYMFAQKWGLGLLASTPFSHDIKLADANVRVGDTKHLPPTLTVQYFPLGGRETVQPYFGLGLNYTTFFSESTTSEFENTLGTIFGTGGPVRADLKLKDSWGVALEAGVDVPIDEHWMFNAA